MAKYRKILVAYDGSDSAKNALAVAADLAKKDNSWVKVLAVVPVYDGDLDLVGISNIKETIEGPGQKLLAEAKKQADELSVHVLANLEQGEPFERIVHVADEENCDLVIMGRSGLSHLERELMGGVTARVIGHTTKHVLVVPEEARLDWHKILVAADGSANSESAVEHAVSAAAEFEGKLAVVTVVDANDEMLAMAPEHVKKLVDKAHEYLQGVVEKAEKKGIAAETFIREGEPHDQITKLADEIGASVIVMGTHGRKGLKRLLMGSVTERTIGYANCPVMIIH
ncbi:MAG: universal stress protein [Desulfobulbaceae bacterium]|nr:universal stress protein [Desulfobulbaceae bacterium]